MGFLQKLVQYFSLILFIFVQWSMFRWVKAFSFDNRLKDEPRVETPIRRSLNELKLAYSIEQKSHKIKQNSTI